MFKLLNDKETQIIDVNQLKNGAGDGCWTLSFGGGETGGRIKLHDWMEKVKKLGSQRMKRRSKMLLFKGVNAF